MTTPMFTDCASVILPFTLDGLHGN